MTSTGTSSFFNKVASDPSSLSEKYLGPNYVYSKWIKSPSEMGMSGGATLDDFSKMGKPIRGDLHPEMQDVKSGEQLLVFNPEQDEDDGEGDVFIVRK